MQERLRREQRDDDGREAAVEKVGEGKLEEGDEAVEVLPFEEALEGAAYAGRHTGYGLLLELVLMLCANFCVKTTF